MEKHRVALKLQERAAVEYLFSAGKTASRRLTHARTLLLADGVYGEGARDEDIVAAWSARLRTLARVSRANRALPWAGWARTLDPSGMSDIFPDFSRRPSGSGIP